MGVNACGAYGEAMGSHELSVQWGSAANKLIQDTAQGPDRGRHTNTHTHTLHKLKYSNTHSHTAVTLFHLFCKYRQTNTHLHTHTNITHHISTPTQTHANITHHISTQTHTQHAASSSPTHLTPTEKEANRSQHTISTLHAAAMGLFPSPRGCGRFVLWDPSDGSFVQIRSSHPLESCINHKIIFTHIWPSLCLHKTSHPAFRHVPGVCAFTLLLLIDFN